MAVLLLAIVIVMTGCGLGFVDLTPPQALGIRLENATPDTVEVKLALVNPSEAGSLDGESSIEPEVDETVVILQSGDVTEGSIVCHEQVTVTATNAVSENLILSGEGTGTPGFDSGSTGQSGERFLLFGEHFVCEDTLVLQLATSQDGSVSVVSAGEAFPEPLTDVTDESSPDGLSDSGEGGDMVDAPEESAEDADLLMQVVNATESTIQINFAAGDGNLTEGGSAAIVDEFDVRIPPFTSTTGPAVCAVEYIVAASHLESTGTTFSEGNGDIFNGAGNVTFHGVVLTGDGTGTEGFDSNTIAVTRGRLLQRGTHYVCGDDVVVTVSATNNQIQLDEEGDPVLDDFGNPTIQYNVGTGTIVVGNP
ncbi:MAG: hypothetical protein ACPGXK_07840 [Phycisphaerae bacterium]